MKRRPFSAWLVLPPVLLIALAGCLEPIPKNFPVAVGGPGSGETGNPADPPDPSDPPDPPDPPDLPDPPDPPPASRGGPCHDPDFPRVLSGQCVELAGRTYNTRFSSGVGDEGNGVFAVKERNGTATYIGRGRRGQVSFETWYDGAFDWNTGGGKHYHQLTSFMADPRGDQGWIQTQSWLRCEIDELGRGRKPRVILWNYFPGWGQDSRYARGAGRAYFSTLPPERTWVKWTFRWEQTDRHIKIWVTRGDNGETVLVESEIQPNTHPIGDYFWPTGHVEGTGQTWYRHRNVRVQ